MKLEFADGLMIEVKAIFGGPQLIDGVLRDTLRIEIDPNTIGFNNLQELFKNNPNTNKLYSHSYIKNEFNTEIDDRREIGEGYSVFVSISDEERTISPVPGKLIPPQKEEVYVVTIAQKTYAEYVLEHQASS